MLCRDPGQGGPEFRERCPDRRCCTVASQTALLLPAHAMGAVSIPVSQMQKQGLVRMAEGLAQTGHQGLDEALPTLKLHSEPLCSPPRKEK